MKKLYILLLIVIQAGLIFAQDNGEQKKTAYHYYRERNYPTALRMLEEEKRANPDKIDIYVIMAWCYRDLKKYDKMEKASKDGLRIRNYDIRVIRNLAEAQYYQKKYSDAIGTLQDYIKLRYKFRDNYLPTAYLFLGYSYLQTEAYHKADIALSMARILRPNHQTTLMLLGETNERLENNKKAHDYYQAVLGINPSHQDALAGADRTKN